MSLKDFKQYLKLYKYQNHSKNILQISIAFLFEVTIKGFCNFKFNSAKSKCLQHIEKEFVWDIFRNYATT